MTLHHFPFLGRKPSQFKVNPIVRAFIVSETFFWSGISLISPIFGIFVANQVVGGSVGAAALSSSIYMIARIVFELVAGKGLDQASDARKFIYSISGIAAISLFHLLFAFSSQIWQVYTLQALIGAGFGVVSPAKYSLFSGHLDKGKESTEWSIYDAANFAGMAAAAWLGGLVAEEYGFKTLFILTALVVSLGATPFILLLRGQSEDYKSHSRS